MHYLISGYYGEGNAGDEAILAGILQEITRQDESAHFTVLSFNPTDTLLRHGRLVSLDAISTSLRSPGEILEAMRRADLLISGGGSFLHEADFEVHGRSFLFRQGKLRPIPYFLTIVCMAKLVGLPVMWYAQGLGPLHTKAARFLISQVASKCEVITWRDRASASLAYEIGVKAPLQLVVPDPAYALVPDAPEKARKVLSLAGFGRNEPFIALCPRPWLGKTDYLDALAKALGAVAKTSGLRIGLIPFHEIQDPWVCRFVANHPALEKRAVYLGPIPSATLLAAVLGEAQIVVAMRLHAAVLATCAGTPVVTVDYDPKTRAFAEQTGQSAWAVSVADLGREQAAKGASGVAHLQRAILDTLAALEIRRASVSNVATVLAQEARKTAALAVQVADRSLCLQKSR